MFKNVVLAMSGGVDSAVAAFLLKKKGFNVTAVFMKNWDILNERGECSSDRDYEDAKWICRKLDIPLFQVNFVKEYWNGVFSVLLEKYQSGFTPNPDILCNKKIKFDKFFHVARNRFQADAIATGHYVRTDFGPYLEYFKSNTDVHLLQGSDPDKDQTFFLSQVPQESLRLCMFPIGNYLKSRVKEIAIEAELTPVLRKKESMGICFVGKREFQDFISEYVEDKAGQFVDVETGLPIGEHKGIHHWTVGQRCKLPGSAWAHFVYKKDIDSNTIFVVKGTNHPALYSDLITVSRPYWITSEPSVLKIAKYVFECGFRFQHRHPLISCKIYKTVDGRLIVRLSKPTRSLTQGQYAVLYSGEICLGSAEISHVGPSCYVLDREINAIDENASMESKCDDVPYTYSVSQCN